MEQATVTTNRRLERGNGPLAGVAAGMADYFGIDPTIVRLGLVATTVLGGPTVPIVYLAAWLIIPAAEEPATAPVDPAAPLAATPPPAPVPVPAPPAPVPPAPAPVPAPPAPAAPVAATDGGASDTLVVDTAVVDTAVVDTAVVNTAVVNTVVVDTGEATETSDATDEDGER